MRGLISSAETAEELVEFLGDPLAPAGLLTYAQAVSDDEAARFPRAALDRLRSWGYPAYQVPAAYGGRLGSLPELVALARVVAGRDPTVAVIANSPLAAAMPVWLAGTEAQQAAVARAVLDGELVALGLTERDHGADVLASDVTARRTRDGYRLNGAKWLINNVRRARYLCLLARDPERAGMRSLSLLLVDLASLPAPGYELLPPVRTHGIRAAEIAGIAFHDVVVPDDTVIGRPGRGLELTARSLLVTRTLVPALSLGALDTGLRCTLDFLRNRRLYSGPAIDIAWVQDELAAAFLELSVSAVVLDACVELLHSEPAVAPIASAVVKYLVPHVATERMRTMGTLLGARYYLREDHWSGIFEKLLRDIRLFGLFDGSEPVVLSALAAQLSCLAAGTSRAHGADYPAGVGAPGEGPVDLWRSLGRLNIVADEDPVTVAVPEVCAALSRSDDDPDLASAVALLGEQGVDLLNRARAPVDPRSEAGQHSGEQYARVFAGACLGRAWLSRTAAEQPVSPQTLAAGLVTLLSPGKRMLRATSRRLFAELLGQCTEGVTFLSCFGMSRKGGG
jgi:alkylation response protein AidB-like acyl-CoA dehydrogenase